MKLNRTTYEIYLVDYLDGKLDAVQVSELLLFLEQNPDLKEEFEGLRETGFLSPEDYTSFDNASLKKPEYNSISSVYESVLIAQLEGDLTVEQVKKLDHAMALYPGLKKDARVFSQTKLQPDPAVIFKNKSQLKVFVIQPYYKAIVRVAAVLLLISFAGLYFSNKETTDTQTATSETNLPAQPGKAKPTYKQSQASAPGKYATAVIPAEAAAGKRLRHKPEQVALHAKQTVIHKEQNESQLVKPNFTSGIHAALADISTPSHIIPLLSKPTFQTEPFDPEEYTDIKTWLVRKFKNETDLKNEEGFLGRINKATRADLVIEKDTTTGKITRFEIAGMGLVQR